MLSLKLADEIADTCLQHGYATDCAPLTVVVLDAGGHVLVAKRSDGSGILRFEIAFGKAWGALGMGLPTRALAKRSAAPPIFLAVASSGRMIPVPGGVLVRDEQDRIVGAVGVSGDTSDRDEICAVAAIRAVNFRPDVEER